MLTQLSSWGSLKNRMNMKRPETNSSTQLKLHSSQELQSEEYWSTRTNAKLTHSFLKLKYPTNDRRQLVYDMDCMKFIVKCNLPFSTVDSEGFKEYSYSFNSRVNVKHSTTFEIKSPTTTQVCEELGEQQNLTLGVFDRSCQHHRSLDFEGK